MKLERCDECGDGVESNINIHGRDIIRKSEKSISKPTPAAGHDADQIWRDASKRSERIAKSKFCGFGETFQP